MGTMKLYARDHHAALVGMQGMTLEERGAYNTILDLIYMHDGSLLDEPASVCKWLGTNARGWKRIRARLLKLKKIYVLAGNIRNERADREIRYAHAKAAERARKRLTVVK
jgi:uncharacterized protein YdaU (DUF1376 family)